MLKRFVLILAIVLTAPASAATFRATLHTVFDGDTIDVLDEKGRQFRVRLSGIDAPERGQPFGQRASESLRRLLSAGPLLIDPHSTDRYQRVLARVTCAGRDAGLEQIRSGFAWFYPWTDSISKSDRVLYAREEQNARALRRGLWIDRDATPPWQFRRTSSFVAPNPILAGQPPVSGPRVLILPADPKPAWRSSSLKPVVHKRKTHYRKAPWQSSARYRRTRCPAR